jgi:antitoxin component YwqK of YwqJK toxin-antitoxin module
MVLTLLEGIIKDKNEMEVNFNDIENRNPTNDGTWGTFYYNNKKFTGVIYDLWMDKVNWIFEVKNGLQDGVEKTFYDGTNILQQIVEYNDNLQNGISKEFNEKGELTSVSVMFRGSVLKTIFLENSLVLKRENFYDSSDKDKYPEKINMLLNLSDAELINYIF